MKTHVPKTNDDKGSKPRSARGLFAATKKKAKPVAMYNEAGEIVKGVLEREPDGFHPTPPQPTQSLIAYEGERIRQYESVWECAAGDGAMADILKLHGLNVVCSDLVDRGYPACEIKSFYDYKRMLARCIITNPPYHESNWGNGRARWIKHARELGVPYMALLMPWNWAGAAGLGKVYDAYRPARVYLMRWKIDFTGQGAPPSLSAWWIWDAAYSGETLLRMMDRVIPGQGALF